LKRGEKLKDGRIWNSTKQKKFTDEELKEYVENNENETLKEIWKHFKVSDIAILKRLRKMNYSYKKKKWGIKKEMKKEEKTIKKN
jgi:Zn-dependent peptidase ImmA (M78 family)